MAKATVSSRRCNNRHFNDVTRATNLWEYGPLGYGAVSESSVMHSVGTWVVVKLNCGVR